MVHSLTNCAYWDLEREPLRLGSLLLLRQELEMMAQYLGKEHIDLYFSKSVQDYPFVDEVLKSSIRFTSHVGQPEGPTWPPPDFPIESFHRISSLYNNIGIVPQLQWNETVKQEAQKIKKSFGSKPVIAIHLKQQTGGAENSNATFADWLQLFEKETSFHFILLGSDPKPKHDLPHVHTLEAPLSVELCLIQYADAFMSMCSSFANQAILSTIPYVIFKHPKHHGEAMVKELIYIANFSLPNQHFWQVEDRNELLFQAIEILKKECIACPL